MHWTATLFLICVGLGFIYVCYRFDKWKKQSKAYDSLEQLHRANEGR